MAMGKSGLLLALGMPKKGARGSEEDTEEVDTGGSAKRDAAQALIDAVKRGDADAVASAFQRAYDACAMGGHSSDEEDDDEEEEEEY